MNANFIYYETISISSNIYVLSGIIQQNAENNFAPERTVKIEPGLTPQPPGPEPWQFAQQQQQQQQQLSPQTMIQVNEQQKAETPTQAADHLRVTPEKNSYPARTEVRSNERAYRDRGRHASPGYDDRQHRRSRSGSRGKEWKDWSVNGRRSDSGERWSERHRGGRRSRERSRSPPAPMRDHLPPYRRSR